MSAKKQIMLDIPDWLYFVLKLKAATKDTTIRKMLVADLEAKYKDLSNDVAKIQKALD